MIYNNAVNFKNLNNDSYVENFNKRFNKEWYKMLSELDIITEN